MGESHEVTMRDYVAGVTGWVLGALGGVLLSTLLFSGFRWYQVLGLVSVGVSWLLLRNNPWNKNPSMMPPR